jgi:hypothetical protein
MDLATRIQRAAKEIDQVSVAVSVVGTRRAKLLELADVATDIAGRLHGDRPEVRRMVTGLRQRVHDVRVARHDRTAAEALEALRDELNAVLVKVRDGLGAADPVVKIGDIAVGNSWGYTDAEVARTSEPIKLAMRRLSEWGFDASRFTLVLDPTWSGSGRWAFYDRDWDTVAMAPGPSGSVGALATELGKAVWYTVFGGKEKETWADHVDRFAEAFSAAVAGDKMQDDDAARLRVSMMPWAAKWPERP